MRAVETWYVHLLHPELRPVDPTIDHKRTPAGGRITDDLHTSAVRAVQVWLDDHDPRTDPPDLLAGRRELRRLE